MNLRRLLARVAAPWVVTGVALSAQSPAPPPNAAVPIAAARAFVATLTLDQARDAQAFSAVGHDRASALLIAVMQRGQDPTATPDEVAAMHHAIAGLIELYTLSGDLYRASLYANFQHTYYRNESNAEAALAASRQALDLQRQSKVVDGLDLDLASVGQDLMSLGRPDEAIQSFREAQRAQADPLTPRAAALWRDLVQAELAAGHRDLARSEVDRFLAMSANVPAWYRARALMAQSDLLIEDGNYTKVVDTVLAARAVMAHDEHAFDVDLDVVSQLLTCVLDSMQRLSYTDALALATRMDTEITGLPIQVAPFAQMAIQARRRLAGDFEGVLRDDTARLAAARQQANIPAQIEILRALATTYRSMNAVDHQILLLDEARQLEQSRLPSTGIPANSADAYAYFRTLNSLGEAYAQRGDIDRARRVYTEARHVAEAIPDQATRARIGDLYAEALLGLARVAELDDDPDEARDILGKALNGEPKGLARFDRATVLIQRARLERSLDEHPERAALDYEQALIETQQRRDRRQEVWLRVEIARFLATVPEARVPGARARAAVHVAAAGEAARALNDATAEWQVAYVSGILAEAAGQTTTAITEYQQAVAKIESLRGALTQSAERQTFVDNAWVQDVSARLIALLIKRGRDADAWSYLERDKARAFLETLQGRRFAPDAAPTPATQELATIEKQIADRRLALEPENDSVLRSAGRSPALIEADLHGLEAKFALARQQAALATTRAGQVLSLTPVSLDRLQTLLDPRTALIEFAVLPDALTAFIVTPKSSRQLTWQTDTDKLRKDVKRLRALLSAPQAATAKPDEELTSLQTKVSATLLANVMPLVPASTNHLVIVPSAFLLYLPFETLDAGGDPLVVRFAISYAPSASTLEFLPRESPQRATNDLFLGALGNVAVDGAPPLPGTLRETDAVAEVYPSAVRASEAQFTHDRARQALLEYDRVHFATHGILDEAAPLFSALLTSAAAGQPSRLSLYELTEMHLRARLVVLSACETGLGRLQSGDEITGLTRTFLQAGANTVVSSLWKVSDESTALLMAGFYRGLRKGLDPSEALRQSVLDVRIRFPHPFFWAPFIVTGAR